MGDAIVPTLNDLNRGAQTDYALGTLAGWDAFDVARWHAIEALDEPFELEIVLLRAGERPPVDIDSLVDGEATFRIASENRWRPVHGIISEAELIDRTASLQLYRAVLVPHLMRAAHRRRCRTFVDKTIREIVSQVLENQAPTPAGGGRGLVAFSGQLEPPASLPSFASFVEPTASYRWAVADAARLDVPCRQVVQYNESDLCFVSRLLETEGISYFFEHGETESLLTLTDRPGHAPLFPHDEEHELVTHVGGTTRAQEVVRSFRPVRRIRPAAVTMRDYAWRRSVTELEATASCAEAAPDLEHFEYPAGDEDDPVLPGRKPAGVQLERYQAERSMCAGTSTVRTHAPGYRFRLIDRDGVRDERHLCVVRVESFAVQRSLDGTVLAGDPFGLTPRTGEGSFYENRFEALPAEMPYRPERKTAKPRIHGVQPARVTAEEISKENPPELNSDELSRVRVRFPWDQRANDGTPSSKWIRVSQQWAGSGFGALHVPRVGHEVLVAFERGDPDRPIIVGRLYNAQNTPPYVEPNTTYSTIRSDSVGEDGASADGFNEFRFEDAANKEQVFLHAQRNLDEVVRASHSTSVGGDQSNSVGGNQSNSVQGNRQHSVGGNEDVTVEGNRRTVFGGDEAHAVAGKRETLIGNLDSLAVGADQRTSITDNQLYLVGGNRDTSIGGNDALEVDGSHTATVAGAMSVSCASYSSVSKSVHSFKSITTSFEEAASFSVKAGAAKLTVGSGMIMLNNGAGAIIALAGASIHVMSGTLTSISGHHGLYSDGGATVRAAGTLALKGSPTNIDGGGAINAKAGVIKLND
jgi:type VI secretion system secreted protein VgrG